MDRSFLLQKEVIEASRDFVCIRLATYEDKEEADYLVKVFAGRLGTLENTVFTMLSPDAKEYLTRSGRGPQWAFSDAKQMGEQMRAFAKEYPVAAASRSLPAMKDFRLSLNVAACDNMPLVVAVSDDAAERTELNEKLTTLAWSKQMLGKYAYSPVATTAQLREEKIEAKPGLYVIEPDAYGQTGKVLARLDSAADLEALSKGLRTALAQFKPPSKEARTHIGQGNRAGVFWKTLLPVTDPNDPESRRR
jgi:hypothetical protein